MLLLFWLFFPIHFYIVSILCRFLRCRPIHPCTVTNCCFLPLFFYYFLILFCWPSVTNMSMNFPYWAISFFLPLILCCVLLQISFFVLISYKRLFESPFFRQCFFIRVFDNIKYGVGWWIKRCWILSGFGFCYKSQFLPRTKILASL